MRVRSRSVGLSRSSTATSKEPVPISSLAYDPLTGLRKTAPGNSSVIADPDAGFSFGPTGTPTSATPATSPSSTPGGPVQPGQINTGSYLDLLRNDPILRQTMADLSAQGISDRSQADTLAQRALIQFGEVPTLEGIDARLAGPEFARIAGMARPLAEQNTQSGLSIVARMEKLRKDNVRAIKNALAARGALRSGETGHQLGEEQQRYTQAQYDARSQLVDLLSGIEAGYANAQRQRAAAQAQAAQGAMGNVIQMFPQGPAPQAAGGQTPNPNTGLPTVPGYQPGTFSIPGIDPEVARRLDEISRTHADWWGDR